MTPQQAAQKYPWCRYDETNNIIELFLDHHMLSTLRMCEIKFVTEHILNIRPRGHRAWNLVFGTYLHSCFELFYNSLRDGDGIPITIDEFLSFGVKLWYQLRLDDYKDEEKYAKVGGLDGARSLLVQYYAYYQSLRMRIVATEITFGFNREVPLGEFDLKGHYYQHYIEEHDTFVPLPMQVKCYLTGRIDMIGDNGYKVGPIDHKTHAAFRGDEFRKFNPHDGVTGYIYAVNKIMEHRFPEYFAQGRRCLSGWVYHISQSSPSKSRKTGEIGPRFKTTNIDKTVEQLEDFRVRQLETFKRVCELLFNNKIPEWTTTSCGNIYGSPCEYITIHEAPSEQWVELVKSHYNVTEPWNPFSPDQSAIIRDHVLDEETIKGLKG